MLGNPLRHAQLLRVQSAWSDRFNVVVLQYVRAESEIKRAMLVLKTRASDHRPEIREFTIHAEGIVLGSTIDLDEQFG